MAKSRMLLLDLGHSVVEPSQNGSNLRVFQVLGTHTHTHTPILQHEFRIRLAHIPEHGKLALPHNWLLPRYSFCFLQHQICHQSLFVPQLQIHIEQTLAQGTHVLIHRDFTTLLQATPFMGIWIQLPLKSGGGRWQGVN